MKYSIISYIDPITLKEEELQKIVNAPWFTVDDPEFNDLILVQEEFVPELQRWDATKYLPFPFEVDIAPVHQIRKGWNMKKGFYLN